MYGIGHKQAPKEEISSVSKDLNNIMENRTKEEKRIARAIIDAILELMTNKKKTVYESRCAERRPS